MAPESFNLVAARVSSSFPERAAEISAITSMLNPLLVPSPPVFVYGPTASGKMVICSSVLSQLKVPFARILCSGYSNRKQLFRAIYSAALCSLQQHQQRQDAAHVSRRLRKVKIGKKVKIYNISGLCQALKELLESVDAEEGCPTKLYLLFGSLFSCNSYEQGLAMKLLHLSSTVAPEIRVVAISREHGHLPSGCFIVRFPAYTDHQLQTILLMRADTELFTLSSSSTQSRKSAFRSLAQDALPRLVLGTRHLGELWSSLVIIWKQFEETQASDPVVVAALGGSKSSDRTQSIVNSIRSRPVVNLTVTSFGSKQSADKSISFSEMRMGDWAATLPVSTRFLLIVSVSLFVQLSKNIYF